MCVTQQTADVEPGGYRRPAFIRQGPMVATITIAPTTTGKIEERRAFVAELQGQRRIERALWQRRRRIARQVITLVEWEPA